MTGAELRQRRAGLGLSQSRLGAALGVPQNTISRWEMETLTIERPQMLDLALRSLEDHMDLYATLRAPEKARPQIAEFTVHTLTDAGWQSQAFRTEEAALAVRDRYNAAGPVVRAAWVDQNGMEIDPMNRHRVEDPTLAPV